MHHLELRRSRIRRLITLALSDKNMLKVCQGYYLLSEIERRLGAIYSRNN